MSTSAFVYVMHCTRWFKYDRDYLCVNESQFVPVIFEPPCISDFLKLEILNKKHVVKNEFICLCLKL
jgi:hypothetical protein